MLPTKHQPMQPIMLLLLFYGRHVLVCLRKLRGGA